MLNKSLEARLASDSFFRTKVRASSPNSVTSNITSHQLVRMGPAEDGVLYLVPQIVSEISLNDASGKSLIKGIYIGVGSPNPITVYASSPAKSREGYEAAARMAVQNFMTDLSKKTKD